MHLQHLFISGHMDLLRKIFFNLVVDFLMLIYCSSLSTACGPLVFSHLASQARGLGWWVLSHHTQTEIHSCSLAVWPSSMTFHPTDTTPDVSTKFCLSLVSLIPIIVHVYRRLKNGCLFRCFSSLTPAYWCLSSFVSIPGEAIYLWPCIPPKHDSGASLSCVCHADCQR